MQLITKTGIVCPGKNGNRTIYYNSTKEEILKEMDESLEKLGTDHVDLLLVHRPDPLADPSETADALETLVKQGKALHVGVSNFMPSQMEMLQSRMRIRLVTNQMELSVKNTENFLMVYWMMHLQEGFRLWRGRRLAEEASFAAERAVCASARCSYGNCRGSRSNYRCGHVCMAVCASGEDCRDYRNYES